jgi:hypothetical protein
MAEAIAFLASAWFGSQDAFARRPDAAAQVVAHVLTGVVEDVPPEDLDAVLRVMASGRLRFLYGDFGPPRGSGDFGDARYVAVVQPVHQPAFAPEGYRKTPPATARC